MTSLMLFTTFLLYLHPTVFAAAPDFTIPSAWRTPTIQASRADLEARASTVANTLVSHIDPGSGSVAGFNSRDTSGLLTVLALQDKLSGNGTFRAQVVEKSLPIYDRTHTVYDNAYYDYGVYHADTLAMGLAAMYAFRTYDQPPSLLALAVSRWELVLEDWYSGNGKIPRNSAFNSTCSPPLQAGALFDVHDGTFPRISAYPVGQLITLSAYLYEATRDAKYLHVAETSAAFVNDVLYRAGDVADTMDGSTCSVDFTQYTWNAGAVIEGLAVLATISENKEKWAALRDELVVSSVNNHAWNTPDGRIKEAWIGNPLAQWQSVAKRFLIRGLTEVHDRNPSADMATLIERYIMIQYSSIMDSATVQNSNSFSTTWTGPPASAFDGQGSVAALEVFNAAFSFASHSSSDNATETKGPSPPDPTSPSELRASKSSAGAIAGGVVGGVLGLTALLLGLILCHRRRRRDRIDTRADPHDILAYEDVPPRTPLSSPKGGRRPSMQSVHTSPAAALPSSPFDGAALSLFTSGARTSSERDGAGRQGDLDMETIARLAGQLNAIMRANGSGAALERPATPPPEYESEYGGARTRR